MSRNNRFFLPLGLKDRPKIESNGTVNIGGILNLNLTENPFNNTRKRDSNVTIDVVEASEISGTFDEIQITISYETSSCNVITATQASTSTTLSATLSSSTSSCTTTGDSTSTGSSTSGSSSTGSSTTGSSTGSSTTGSTKSASTGVIVG